MKTTKNILLLLVTIGILAACKNNRHGNPADHYEHQSVGDGDPDRNMQHDFKKSDTPQDAANKMPAVGQVDSAHISGSIDESFVNEAAAGTRMELELAQLARQKAADPRVRAFGAMMVADHGKAGNELKLITGAKKHILPAELPRDHQNEISSLSKKQGNNFDLSYIKLMVREHERDIRAFKIAGERVTDTTVKAFARRTLPLLQKHLDSARAIYRSLQGR